MKNYTLYFLLSIILFTSCGQKIEDTVNELVEQAYFEGQKDALENDVRIKKNQDSCWVWVKSPWNSGKNPIFVPSFDCQKNVDN